MRTRTVKWLLTALLCTGTMLGCTFEEFIDESYAVLLDRYPVWNHVFAEDEPYPSQMDNASTEYLTETHLIEGAILKKLETFDYDALSHDQKITYDFYHNFLIQDLKGSEFRYHNMWYDSEVRLGGYGSFYFWDFPIEDFDDALEYAKQIANLKHYFGQVLENFQTARKKGIVPSRSAVAWQIETWTMECGAWEPFGELVAFEETLMYLVDSAGIEFSESEWNTLLAELQASTAEYAPKCTELWELLFACADQAPIEHGGVWVLPDGDEYYQNRLGYYNDTSMSPVEIHALGQSALDALHQQIRSLLSGHGYPVHLSIPELMQLLNQDCPQIDRDGLAELVETTIATAENRLTEVVDLVPAHELEVWYMDDVAGGYILPMPNGSTPGLFVLGLPSDQEQITSLMIKSIIYHEALPGHHLQLSIASAADIPDVRKIEMTTAFAEGWALYGERLARELDWYSDDLCGEVGQLLAETLRAIRLVVDTGLHAFEWTPEEALAYATANLGEYVGTVSIRSEIDRYIFLAGQATAYYIGLQEILSQRERAQRALGDRFSLVDFNRTLIENGNLYLPMLERLIEEYIADRD